MKFNPLFKSLMTGFSFFLLLSGATPAVSGTSTTEAEEEARYASSPIWISELGNRMQASQLFVVAGVGQTTAYVSMHEKTTDGSWRQIMSTPGYIGKNGLGKQREGDGKTPVGIFHFNYAFGIADNPGCQAFPYKKVNKNDYWSGDARKNRQYNKMVSIKDYPDLDKDASEHLVDYTYPYQYALNISYNEEGTPGLGSAIFLHCLGEQRPYTGGCVSIPRAEMITVLRHVRQDCVVVIDYLKNLSQETYRKWGLK
ncbi:L,D-transpeptidase family protein [Succinimonas amylolytica]|uniref:L,D-transpeptidase family protein n=1 Tax=Succinimonas amylolytica TaxID=83769 RepID=UPI00037D2BD9|nr:L,D-transpeptidase family protein [Succinimonas amylolytica]